MRAENLQPTKICAPIENVHGVSFYDGRRYVLEDDLDSDIRRWLIGSKLPHNNLYVSNVANDIRAMRRDRRDLPFWRQGDGRGMLAFRNGLLDLGRFLEDGSLLLQPHTPDYVSDFCLPYDLDPDHRCDLWLEKVMEILEDEAKVALLREWYGYCFTSGQEHQKLLLKVGVTRSGKGLTDAVLEAMVGQEYACGLDIHKLATSYGTSTLVGKKVAFVGECHLERDPNKYRILEMLKTITGGDRVPIEGKYKDPGSMPLPVKLSISANDMPRFFDDSGALATRLLILSFNRSFEGQEDRTLLKKLLSELPGIAVWALEGLRRLHQQGHFTEPAESQEIRTRVRREGSPILAFLQDCCVVQRAVDPGNLVDVPVVAEPCAITSQALRGAIHLWSDENDVQPNFDLMVKGLNSLMPKLRTRQRRDGGKVVRVYEGIRLTDDAETRVQAWVRAGCTLSP